MGGVSEGNREEFSDFFHAEYEKLGRALYLMIGDRVEASYRRGDLFGKRTKLMQAWSAYCSSPSRQRQNGNGDVIPLRAR